MVVAGNCVWNGKVQFADLQYKYFGKILHVFVTFKNQPNLWARRRRGRDQNNRLRDCVVEVVVGPPAPVARRRRRVQI